MSDTLNELMAQLDDGPVVDQKGPPADELEIKERRTLDVQVKAIDAPKPVALDNQIMDLKKIADQLAVTSDEVLQACRNDRQEVQDVIDTLKNTLNSYITAQNAGAAPRAYIDNLVKALEVKAGINLTAVKMMEANSKMIASLKPSTLIQNNMNVDSDSSDLRSILDEPLTEGIDDF